MTPSKKWSYILQAKFAIVWLCSVCQNTKQASSSTFCRRRETWSFHILLLQKTPKKCTKIYNARAQVLFSLLNYLMLKLFFCHLLTATSVKLEITILFQSFWTYPVASWSPQSSRSSHQWRTPSSVYQILGNTARVSLPIVYMTGK